MTALDPEAAAADVRLVEFAAIDSTNAEALRRARAGERGPLWIFALSQTAGRGRRGRPWSSESGNFSATLLAAGGSGASLAQLSFVTALAVLDAIAAVTGLPQPRLELKWPNDVLVDGKKAGGILLEGDSAARDVVAIGIGINCASHPTDVEFPATDLAVAGFTVLPGLLLKVLSVTMLRRMRQWDEGKSFASIRTDWLRHAHGLGRPVRARLNDRTIEGCFEALDEAGRLVLRLPSGGAELITAADIFPLAAH
jgi:BirA family biotin operon repressor/biotin-[acetyl-CoA-carboxylase] ligase